MLLSSCGSFESGKRTVFIQNDSKVTKFKIDEKEYETPIFLKLGRGRKHFLELDKRNNYVYRCQFDFRNSIIPNSIFLLSGTPGLIISGSMFGADLITGGLYHCQNDINLGFEKEERQVSRKILVVPPPISDPIIQEKILKHWRNQVFEKNKKDSDSLIDPELGSQILIGEGVNVQTNNPPNNWPRAQFNRVGEKLQFTHIVYFHVTKREKSISVRSILYSHLEKRIKKKNNLSKLMVVNQFELKLKDYFWKAFKFLPNSIAVNMLNNLEVKPSSSAEVKLSDHPNAWPKAIRYLALESTLNYDLYKNWQVGVYFAPSLNADTWSINAKYGEDEEPYFVHSQILQFLYGSYLYWKTPFGAWSFGANTGLGVIDNSSNLPVNETHYRLIYNFNVRYQYNFTRRFYIAYDARQVKVKMAQLGQNINVKDYIVYNLRLGFFLPEIESWFKSFFY